MKVLIINGHAESGKSTFVNFCKEFPTADVYEFSMVDAAKTMAKIIGWEETDKTEKDRNFLSYAVAASVSLYLFPVFAR